MAVGWAAAFANSQLSVLRGTSHAGVSVYAKLHVGDPGSAGTANPSAVTTRNQVTFGSAPASGVLAATSIPSWSMTATETITHISLWDAASAGNLIATVALGSSKAVNASDTLTLTSLQFTRSPLAA